MRWILLTLALLSLPMGVPAQGSTRDAAASAFVPPDHWSRACLSVLDGATPAMWGVDAGAGVLMRRAVARAFEAATAGGEPWIAEVSDGCRARFSEEYAASSRAPARASWRLGVEGAAAGAYEHRRGVLGTGRDDSTGWVAPAPLEDRSRGRFRFEAGLAPWDHVAAAVELRADAASLQAREAYVVVAAGPVAAWGGRRRVAYGELAAARLVLEAPEPLDGGGVFLARPVRLPGPLAVVGPVRFETMLARLERSGPVRRPWLWAMRAQLQPHPRLGLAINRAALFGGVGNGGFGLGDFASMVAGLRRGDATRSDNQVASVEARWLPPLPALRPALRVEIAFDDGAGAWLDVPGVAVHVEARRVPGLPGLQVGVSRTSFAASCCGHPPWYRHLGLPGGWSLNGRPLGHALAGDGEEWRVRARLDAADRRLRASAAVFRRERGGENLYAPDRIGRSWGGALSVAWRAAPRLELAGLARREAGRTDWSETYGHVGVQWFF